MSSRTRPKGNLTLIRALRQAQVNRIGLEATGLYHLDLALALDDAGFELMVINAKAGNRYLRIALDMPALSAARHDPNVRPYYRHLIETRGLKKLQAVCAVMRKLLHAIHARLKNRTPFKSSRFYTPTETVS